jgi:hypothetical protein
MIERVISGGQSGADQAAWRAAKAAGIPTGGWMPLGFLTEDGPRPEFAELYGAREHPSPEYPPRTRANVALGDLLLVFDTSGGKTLETISPGSRVALREAMAREIPSYLVMVGPLRFPATDHRVGAMAARIREGDHSALTVGGNRESKAPGIGAWVEDYLGRLFALLRA